LIGAVPGLFLSTEKAAQLSELCMEKEMQIDVSLDSTGSRRMMS